MNIHSYYSSSGKDLIMNYILNLPYDEKTDGLSVLKALEDDKINYLHTKPWQGKISEVYFYKHNRIFYVIVDGKDLYLLHTCRKQKNKTEKRDKEIVLKRAKQLGVELGRKFV